MKVLKLKASRVKNGYIQKDLAEFIGVTEKTYNRKELGLVSFSIQEIKQLAKILDLSLEDINDIFFDNELTTCISKTA